MTLPLRQLEGKYEILHKIREGGMGAIYKVRHLLLEEVRVVKVIRPQFAGDENLQKRFLREARTAIRLRHPNIAQLYDFAVNEDDGTSYIVMEYISGVTLEEMLRKSGPPSIDLGLVIAQQGLKALSYLHHQGYIHRDISPDNLMLTRDFQGQPLIKLIDLGIAKPVGAEAELTQTGMFLGKVRYAPPEQFSGGAGAAQQDHRSDVYSFGILLYELLTGVCPIQGENISEIIAAHLFREPRPFEEADPHGRVKPELRELVLKALQKSPDDRFANADSLIGELRRFIDPAAPLAKAVAQVLESTATLSIPDEPTTTGSTQSRLNQQFSPVTTPNPTSPLDLVGELPPPEGEGQGTEERLANAQLLAKLEQYDQAEREVSRVLEAEPENAEAKKLLSRVREARSGEPATASKEDASPPPAAIDSTAETVADEPEIDAEARKLSELSQLTAQRQAESASAPAPAPEPKPAETKTELDATELEITKITELLESGNLVKAERSLADAVEQWGETAELAQLREKLALKRRRCIELARRSISRALVSGDLDQAEREAEFAIRRYGEAKRLLDLRRQVQTVRAGGDAAEAVSLVQEDVHEPGSSLQEAELDLGGGLSAPVESTHTVSLSTPGKSGSKTGLWLALAAVAALVVAGLVWFSQKDGGLGGLSASSGDSAGQTAGSLAAAGPTGSLMVNALPWARVEAIRDADGNEVELGKDPHTPLVVDLPPGEYVVTLSNPHHPPNREVETVVQVGETTRTVVEVAGPDVDRYFSR